MEQQNKQMLQWYPGHMTKAKRQMQEDIKLVDLVIEIIDARTPMSSRNPDIDTLAKNKLRLLVMNKCDLSDERANVLWEEYFKEKGFYVVRMDARNRSSVMKIKGTVDEICREKQERDKKRGIMNRPVRAMVVGIPNVGKSTFINSYAGRASAKTGNKPGVTKANQWIRLNKQMELLDTPGILWPKFEDQDVARRLAFIGSIKDDIMNLQELAMDLLVFLKDRYPELLKNRYEKSFARVCEEGTADEASEFPAESSLNEEERTAYGFLGEIARERGCIGKGNTPDYDKAALFVLDDFRSARIGRITLELPKK